MCARDGECARNRGEDERNVDGERGAYEKGTRVNDMPIGLSSSVDVGL